MSTVVSQGLNSVKLVSQGFGASVGSEVVASIRAQVAGFIDGQDPTATLASTGSGGFIATGRFAVGPQVNRGLVWFDPTSIPPDATVISAVLKLFVAGNFLGDSHTLNVYRLKRRWWTDNLNRASYNNYYQAGPTAWTTAGAEDATNDRYTTAVGSLSITSGTTGQVSITLTTAAIQELIDGSVHCRGGFLLQASNEAGDTLMRWAGHEVTTAANRPTLEVTYTAPSHQITEDLVAYYKEDDAAPNDDSSGNNHSLTAINGPASAVGKLGEARHFVAGSSQRQVAADNIGIDWSLSWTITFWYKLTDNANLYTAVSCADNYSGSATGGAKIFYHDVDILDYWVAQLYDDSAGISPGDPIIADTVAYDYGSPPVGIWAFVALRHDHLRKFFHVVGPTSKDCSAHHSGGVLNGTQTPYDGTPNDTANALIIGAVQNGASSFTEHFNGDIDNITVHNRCLSDEEIQTTLYNGGSGLEIGSGGGSGRRRGRFGALRRWAVFGR